ncbi:hypothetical protein AZE42_10263 [Rhizopogon vesiculosus]|uniref:HAT C-terminal dimerisation domain-containing protein n=1 Tax=Rhizopogon vesiculosus TaxID=180088 RepID=A0A1J8QCW8_9AGAM|nr:hypothetical protein AZE42_10263 [Rhizopogon vesiculosus]
MSVFVNICGFNLIINFRVSATLRQRSREWWRHHSIQYPSISRIAKDYLAIQGSAVASERVFSSGGITGTTRRNSLLPQTFETLQLLKSAYR